MTDVFLKYSGDKLEQYASRIEDCLGRLSEEQVWMRNSESENAIGNLVLHLCGNLRQWIGFGIAGLPDIRHRDGEFAARDGVTVDELKQRLQTTVREMADIIAALPPERLTQTAKIQGYEVSVLEVIYHVVEHFSGHAGQILFATKLWTGADLGFHRHLTTAHSERVP